MTDRPIIFSAPMVKALLAGRKSQTRRIIKPHPEMQPNGYWHVSGCGGGICNVRQQDVGDQLVDYVPWHEGQRLWVREAHAFVGGNDPGLLITRADYPACVPDHYENVPPEAEIRWRPSIHMPRWASRLTLTVTDVRIQRLQDISEEDAEAEGCEFDIWDMALACRDYSHPDAWFQMWGEDCGETYVDYERIWRASFQSLWNSLHGPDAWSANPWVAALSFTTHPANIDALPIEPHLDRDGGEVRL